MWSSERKLLPSENWNRQNLYFKSQKKTCFYNQFCRYRERIYGAFVVERQWFLGKSNLAFEGTSYCSQQPVRPWQRLCRQIWVMWNRTSIQPWCLGRAVFCSTSASMFLDYADFIRKWWPLPCKGCCEFICWIEQTNRHPLFLWKGSQQKCSFLKTSAKVWHISLLM